MKTNFRIACLLATICCLGACSDDDNSYPRTTLLGEKTLAGTLVSLPIPNLDPGQTPLPGVVVALSTPAGDYILTLDGQWQTDATITIDGATYSSLTGDKAEVTGTASKTEVTASEAFYTLDIKTIRKLSPDDYPKTVPLGERTLSGTLALLPNPPSTNGDPTLPGMVLGLQTADADYLLTRHGQWTTDHSISIDGVTLTEGDHAQITGTATETQLSATEKYLELEITAIGKLAPNEYPQTLPLGERTLSGTLALLPNPPSTNGDPTLPGMVLGLQTADADYLLTLGDHWTFDRSITLAGVTLTEGDHAQITGTASETQLSATEKYLELEILRIEPIR